jgi:beta-glucanase (GH16 family)
VTTQDRRTATYGRVEARMKLPQGKGLWPAFWMLGANYPLVDHPMCGEIDIMELVGDEPGRIWSSVHGPGYTLSGLTAKYDLPAGQTYHDGFHTFALDWSPSELVFSVDGTVYHRVPRSAIDDNPWVFDQPFFIILNLTVGGSWGGEPAATTTFPAQMVIDHVAVYSAD